MTGSCAVRSSVHVCGLDTLFVVVGVSSGDSSGVLTGVSYRNEVELSPSEVSVLIRLSLVGMT